MELTVIEQNGWKKPYKFEKAVVRIGSATANDLQLSSPGIIPTHLQVMYTPEAPGSCKALNLGTAIQLKSGGKESIIESYIAADLHDGDELVLGEYRILFHLPLSAGLIKSSRQIAASLSVGDAVLRSDLPTTGFLRLQNLGTNPNCQFQVAVNGLSEECFQIDPLPILYPGAEEEVRLQFFHRSTTPPAGHQVITVSVMAPASYPGEQVIIQQGLYVSPLLKTEINLTDDMPVPKAESPIPPPPAEVKTNLPESKIAPPMPTLPIDDARELPAASTAADDMPVSQADVSIPPALPEVNANLPEPQTDVSVLPPLPEADAKPRKTKIDTPIIVSPPDEADEPHAIPATVSSESAITVQKDIFTTKVVRNPSEAYWDENS